MEYWKFKVIDRLKDYPLQQAAIHNLMDDIQRLTSERASIKSASMDGTPVKGGGSTREDRLLSNMVSRGEAREMLKRAQIATATIERGLMELTDEDKHVLDVMYMHRNNGYIERLMDELGLQDARSVYKRADKALYRLTMALYGRTEG